MSCFGGRRVGKHLTESDIEKTLIRAQFALRDIRWRIGVIWLLLAGSAGLALQVYRVLEFGMFSECVPTGAVHAVAWEFLFSLLFDARLVLLSLAPLADDDACCRCVLASDIVLICAVRAIVFYRQGFGTDVGLTEIKASWGDCPQRAFLLLFFYTRGVVFVLQAVWAMLPRSKGNVQHLMWTTVYFYILLSLVEDVTWIAHVARTLSVIDSRVGHLVSHCSMLAFTVNSSFRSRMQARLWAKLEGRAVYVGAASIANLIGGTPAKEVMAQAQQRFRAVSASEVSMEVLANNLPNPNCGALARPCRLGSCDAFVSHSWHDDGPAKWKALGAWRASFLAKHGREPTVWFDKCCVDQNDIEADLRCLPVFLKGCNHLVIFCGPTYLSRLWCILELFTYVLMEGQANDLEVVPILREGHELEDERAINQAFGSFDASECECFRKEDKERILHIIRTAYGGVDGFNCVVQEITSMVRRSITPSSLIRAVSKRSDVSCQSSLYAV